MAGPVQEQLAVQATSAITYGSSIGAVVLAFFDQHAAGIGAMVAVVAFIVNAGVNWYYKRKHYKLAERGK